MPYNNRAGGNGDAHSPARRMRGYNEYYPRSLPTTRCLAFNRIPNGRQMYNKPHAEVFVIPAAGGTATRLAANDPPACTGKRRPA